MVFDKVKYDNEYKRKNYKRYLLEFSKENDKKIIEYLDKQPNKKQVFKNAIIEYMNK